MKKHNFYKNNDLRYAFIEWVGAENFDYGLTINFNLGKMSFSTAKKKLGLLFAMIEGDAIGRSYHKRLERRMVGVFSFENLESNAHCHGVVKLNGANREKFLSRFSNDRHQYFSKIVKSGTVKLQDRAGCAAAAYLLKAQNLTDGTDGIVLLNEFHPI